MVLLVGTLSVAGAGFARFGYPPLLPDMKEGLGATYSQMGLMATVNNLAYVVSSLVGSMLGARFGARRVISISLFLVGSTTFATGLSPGVEFALAMQFLTGLTAGGCVMPAVGLASAWFDPARRGTATGVLVGGLPLGILLSARILSPVLASYGSEGWRYGWYALGVPIFLLGIPAFLFIRDRPAANAHGGAALPEEAVASPLQWGKVYRSRTVWLLCAINGSVGLAAGIFFTFSMAYLASERGLGAAEAGSVWSIVGLAGCLSLIWGAVSDRIGRIRALGLDYYLFSLSLVLLTFVPFIGAYYLSAVLAGLTLFGAMAITAALCGDVMGPRLAPVALGLISLFFTAAQMVTPTLAGALTDLTGSFVPSLASAAVIAFLGASLGFLLKTPH